MEIALPVCPKQSCQCLVRALSSALMVLASALSPGIMGWMIDAGVTMEDMAWMALVYVALGTVLLAIASVSIRRTL